MFAWLLGSAIGRIISAVIGTFVLCSILYGGCQIKACIAHKEEVKAKAAEKALEIYQNDQKAKEIIEGMTDEELVNFARTGVLPKRLQP